MGRIVNNNDISKYDAILKEIGAWIQLPGEEGGWDLSKVEAFFAGLDYKQKMVWNDIKEYTGGVVVAYNGQDIVIGEINEEGDCISEEGSIILCGIIKFAKKESLFP